MIRLDKLLMVTPAQSIKLQVLSRAACLTKAQQAQLTLFTIAEELPKEQLALITVLPPQELENTLLERQRLALEECAEQYEEIPPNIDFCAVSGTPFIEAIRKVKDDQYDLVVLASRGIEHPRKRFFGSTTLHLVRKCPCPVWAVGEHEHKTIKRIVAAVDVYAPTEPGLQLNEDILQWASWLAKQERAELHIVHAWQSPSDDYLKGLGFSSEIDRCEAAMKEQQNRQKRLDKLGEGRTNVSPPLIRLVEGRPQEVIPKYVEDHRIDLIIIGTVCRVGISGFFIGNTAESILGEVGCSVLTLKPKGFVSPVV